MTGRAGMQTPGASVHWYGKHEVVTSRKVGHVTIVANTNAEARSRLAAIDPAAAAALQSTSEAFDATPERPSDSSKIITLCTVLTVLTRYPASVSVALTSVAHSI